VTQLAKIVDRMAAIPGASAYPEQKQSAAPLPQLDKPLRQFFDGGLVQQLANAGSGLEKLLSMIHAAPLGCLLTAWEMPAAA
jgi:uncharacterized protein YidB (DUF937 family)